MSWTYTFGATPTIDYVRMLIADTNPLMQLFQDSEIMSGYGIVASQFQSSMFWSGPGGSNLPSTPVSYLRVAAILLDCLAANKAFLASIKSLPDVTLAPEVAARALQAKAQGYREVDDNAGAMVIIEQCGTDWAIRDRYWAQIQRQTGG